MLWETDLIDDGSRLGTWKAQFNWSPASVNPIVSDIRKVGPTADLYTLRQNPGLSGWAKKVGPQTHDHNSVQS